MVYTLPSLIFKVTDVPEVSAVDSSIIALSNLTTPFASAVTALDASVVPKVVMSKYSKNLIV